MTDHELERLMERHVAELGEHFDAIQIMVCWNEEGKTRSIKRGGGLWHARQGLAHEFIHEDIAQDTAYQIGKQINPPPDEDEWKAAAE